jgi:hypothetical protein
LLPALAGTAPYDALANDEPPTTNDDSKVN